MVVRVLFLLGSLSPHFQCLGSDSLRLAFFLSLTPLSQVHALVTRAQCMVRLRLARKALAFRRRKRFHGQGAARRIQKLWWTALFRMNVQRKFYHARFMHEQTAVAVLQLQKTIHYQHIDFTWSGAKKVRQTDSPQLELQRFFSAYASAGMLDITGLLKMVKDCKDLLDKKFNLKVRASPRTVTPFC